MGQLSAPAGPRLLCRRRSQSSTARPRPPRHPQTTTTTWAWPRWSRAPTCLALRTPRSRCGPRWGARLRAGGGPGSRAGQGNRRLPGSMPPPTPERALVPAPPARLHPATAAAAAAPCCPAGGGGCRPGSVLRGFCQGLLRSRGVPAPAGGAAVGRRLCRSSCGRCRHAGGGGSGIRDGLSFAGRLLPHALRVHTLTAVLCLIFVETLPVCTTGQGCDGWAGLKAPGSAAPGGGSWRASGCGAPLGFHTAADVWADLLPLLGASWGSTGEAGL